MNRSRWFCDNIDTHQSQAGLADALRDASLDVGQAQMAAAVGVSHAHFRKMLQEPKRLLRLQADKLVSAARQLGLTRDIRERLVESWHTCHSAHSKSSGNQRQTVNITSENWRDWLLASTTLLDAGRDNEALKLGTAVFVAGRASGDAEWVLTSGREISGWLRLRSDYGQATMVARQMLSALREDGPISNYLLLARHNAALTAKARNPFATLDVDCELADIVARAPTTGLRRLALRDRLSTLWASWLYSGQHPHPVLRSITDRFEPGNDDSLETFYDHEVLARALAVLGDKRADQHIELASKTSGQVAKAFQHKLQRVVMTQASVRKDVGKMDDIWLSRRTKNSPFGSYDHYSRDMDALCARSGLLA